MREFAVQQVIRAARELALLHTDRNRKLVDGVSHPICDRCRATLPTPDDYAHHEHGCPVGRALHFIHELALLTPGLVSPCLANPALGTSSAGDFLRPDVACVEPCFLPGAVCGAPDCPCDAVTRCRAAQGCNFPHCNCDEENRCPESYPAAAQGGVA